MVCPGDELKDGRATTRSQKSQSTMSVPNFPCMSRGIDRAVVSGSSFHFPEKAEHGLQRPMSIKVPTSIQSNLPQPEYSTSTL
ncbi:hypothetical protein Mapa_003619 [Marchantia paleacea]|nr:hypothetical protein Mapa_003619 [Marchantia paleacea]